MCVWCVCMLPCVQIWTCMHTLMPEKVSDLFSWERVSLFLELGWRSPSPNEPPVSTHFSPHCAESYRLSQSCLDPLHGWWGFKLRSSWLGNKHSYPLNHMLNPYVFLYNGSIEKKGEVRNRENTRHIDRSLDISMSVGLERKAESHWLET